jgi:Domain of unknown function (DUF4148)
VNHQISAIIVSAVLAAPVVSFAQSNQPVTRAQVRAELIQLEKAGYNPGAYDPYYPDNLLAAQARVTAQNGTTSYGPAISGSSQSGNPEGAASMKPVLPGQ